MNRLIILLLLIGLLCAFYYYQQNMPDETNQTSYKPSYKTSGNNNSKNKNNSKNNLETMSSFDNISQISLNSGDGDIDGESILDNQSIGGLSNLSS